ncbi:MAG: hypothetical protein IJX26_01115 [Clostridia bacterium]|nr:hypothetical protein [Clostridia bacterium]
MKAELAAKKFFNLIAFCALILAAVALLVSKILGWLAVATDFSAILNTVSYVLAFVVTAMGAFNYVRTLRSWLWMLIYVAALLIVVVPLVLSLFNI